MIATVTEVHERDMTPQEMFRLLQARPLSEIRTLIPGVGHVVLTWTEGEEWIGRPSPWTPIDAPTLLTQRSGPGVLVHGLGSIGWIWAPLETPEALARYLDSRSARPGIVL